MTGCWVCSVSNMQIVPSNVRDDAGISYKAKQERASHIIIIIIIIK